MAHVLVGEPGNGKTFLIEFLCNRYRRFLANETNRKYTFKFNNMDKLGSYGRITSIESQTYEDPLILAMNLLEDPDENKTFLAGEIGFSDDEIEKLYENYRPLAACSGYIWNDICNFTDGKIDEMLEFVEIIWKSTRDTYPRGSRKKTASNLRPNCGARYWPNPNQREPGDFQEEIPLKYSMNSIPNMHRRTS